MKIIAVAANELGLPVFHLDVSQAFVQAPLEEEIYMRLPPFAVNSLVKSLGFSMPYGLKQVYRCLLTGFLPTSAAASIFLFKPPYAIGSVPSLSGHAIAYRWRSLPSVCRHRASKPQGSSE